MEQKDKAFLDTVAELGRLRTMVDQCRKDYEIADENSSHAFDRAMHISEESKTLYWKWKKAEDFTEGYARFYDLPLPQMQKDKNNDRE